jgi:transcriptional regulator with XRE-family HTH domain
MKAIKPTPLAAAGLPPEAQAYARLLGASLREARTARGETRAALASRLLIGAATLKRMEKGDPRVSLGYYLAVAMHLGVPALAVQTSPQVGLRAIQRAATSRARRKRSSDDWFR